MQISLIQSLFNLNKDYNFFTMLLENNKNVNNIINFCFKIKI